LKKRIEYDVQKKPLTGDVSGCKHGATASQRRKRSQTMRPYQPSKNGQPGYEFDVKATEVAILDRSGRAIWTKTKGEELSPIRWGGTDATGNVVQSGDYICKIVYPNAKVAYLPFVFMQKK
jgi:hypothetical protein